MIPSMQVWPKPFSCSHAAGIAGIRFSRISLTTWSKRAVRPKMITRAILQAAKINAKKGECGCSKPSCQQDGADQKSGKQGFSVLQREHRQFSSLFIFAEKRGTVIVRKDEIDLIGPRTFV